MKDVSSTESLVVPDGVTVILKARKVTVEGPRGKLVKSVSHIQMDLQLVSWAYPVIRAQAVGSELE